MADTWCAALGKTDAFRRVRGITFPNDPALQWCQSWTDQSSLNMASNHRHVSGRHSSASHTRQTSFVLPDSHPGGSQSVHHSRANSRQQSHKHHHHHHHRRSSHVHEGGGGGISFISEHDIRRPKSRMKTAEEEQEFTYVDHPDLLMEQENKQFCKRSSQHHQVRPKKTKRFEFSKEKKIIDNHATCFDGAIIDGILCPIDLYFLFPFEL